MNGLGHVLQNSEPALVARGVVLFAKPVQVVIEKPFRVFHQFAERLAAVGLDETVRVVRRGHDGDAHGKTGRKQMIQRTHGGVLPGFVGIETQNHFVNVAFDDARVTALDLIFSDRFSRDEPGVFEPLRAALLTGGDRYMHLADLRSYLEADERLTAVRRRGPDDWARKVIHNIAASGKFSSDRTIHEYATEIWGAKPVPGGVGPAGRAGVAGEGVNSRALGGFTAGVIWAMLASARERMIAFQVAGAGAKSPAGRNE